MIDILGTSLVAITALSLFWAGYGWWGILGLHEQPQWFRIATAVTAVLFLILGAGLFYWGIVVPLQKGEIRALSENMAFDTLTLACAALLVYARWLVIPESERTDWPIWKAPMHPTRRCLIPWAALSAWWRRIFKD